MRTRLPVHIWLLIVVVYCKMHSRLTKLVVPDLVAYLCFPRVYAICKGQSDRLLHTSETKDCVRTSPKLK